MSHSSAAAAAAASGSSSSPRTPRLSQSQPHLPRPSPTSPTTALPRSRPPNSGTHLPFIVSRDTGELSTFPRYEDMTHYAQTTPTPPGSSAQDIGGTPGSHHHMFGASPGKGLLQTLMEGVGHAWSGHRRTGSASEATGLPRVASYGTLGGPPSPQSPKRPQSMAASGSNDNGKDPAPPSPMPPLGAGVPPEGREGGDDVADGGDDEDSTWFGKQRLSSWSLMALTISLAGAQAAWTVELGSGTPFLLSLGLTPALTSLVWLAGPLSGLVMQPLIGALSDRSTSRFRRRKYMLAALVLICLSTLALAFCQPIGAFLAEIFTPGEGDWDPRKPGSANGAAVAVAVTSFYILDFSLNALQAASRALILDRAPAPQQGVANAWHGRMTHLGNLVGYGVGVLNLAKWRGLTWLGGGQFRKLCVVCLVFLAVCVGITCATQEEGSEALRDAEAGVPFRSQTEEKRRVWRVAIDAVKDIWRTLRHLPAPVRRVCIVQLFAWCSWFPFLFYASTYVAEILLLTTPSSGDEEVDQERALRTGSKALLAYACVAMVAGSVLPWITTFGRTKYLRTRPTASAVEGKGRKLKRAKAWDWTRRILTFCTPRNFWTASLVFSFILMCCTFGVRSVHGASTIVALVGIPWAVACWVPFALIMEYIRELEDVPAPQATCLPPEVRPTSPSPARMKAENPDSPTRGKGKRQAERALSECAPLLSDDAGPRRHEEGATGAPTKEGSGGTMLGIHNLSIVAPQFLVSLIAALIFRLLDSTGAATTTAASLGALGPTNDIPGGDDDRLSGMVRNDVVWVLRFGGLMALLAAVATRWLIPPPSELDYWDDLLEWQMYRDEVESDLDQEE